MKKIYEAPEAQIIDLMAMEKIALIEDNDGSGVPNGTSQGTGNMGDF